MAAIIFLSALITVTLMPGTTHAQETPCPAPFEVADAVTALTFAEGVFAPDMWDQSFRGDAVRVAVQWDNRETSAVAYLDYLIFACGYDDDEFAEYFNEDYWDITLSTYETWERGEQCEQDGVILHEFKLTTDEQPYRMRYWIAPLNDTRILTMQLTFPSNATNSIDAYAAQLFPALPACG